MKAFLCKVCLAAMIGLTFPAVTVKAQKSMTLPKQYAVMTLQSVPEGAKVYYKGQLICASKHSAVEIQYLGVIDIG